MNENKPLRIGFIGTPDFAAEALKAIGVSAHDVVCVYTQPPRPKGRGHKLQPSPVHQYADEHGIQVFHPKSLKSADVQAEFAAHNLDVAVVAAYGLILPKPILDAPKYGCINIHASLLPRWRGASPIQRAIWAGDAQSGVTLIQMNEGLDTGPEIMKTALDLDPRETAQTLHDRLATLGADMIVKALDKLAITGQLIVKEQESEGAKYAHMLKKNDGQVNWNQTATTIDRQIRALNPWPGVWAQTQEGQRLKILTAQLAETTAQSTETLPTSTALAEKDRPVGMLLDKAGHVQCGQGTILCLQRIQPAGKQAMDLPAALNGGYLKIGEILT
ncbi:MAG: methionyl-tRNA formyltransferase [Rhodospirillales bacterium]|nr:methionyl-tRNA formyltransferase [Alphaproteobacteria bacterium]MCB9981484.1 methionyl-tRNA formyltransferase [Rhodospirillales bacterium]